MGMGFAPTWLRHVSPPPLLHMTTLTTARVWNALPHHVTSAASLPVFRSHPKTYLLQAPNVHNPCSDCTMTLVLYDTLIARLY